MDTSTYAARLKQVRGTMTQDDFAQLLGVHKNTYGRYERGDATLDIGLIEAICTKLSVNKRWFFLGEGPMHADGRVEPTTPPSQTTQSGPVSEIGALWEENRALRAENRELRQENRELIKENADLRVELAEIKARAAPHEGSTRVLGEDFDRQSA